MDNQMLPKSYGRQREEQQNRTNNIRAAENKTQAKDFLIANNCPSPSYQHVYVVNEVQEEHRQLHDEVCVVHVCSLTLPRPWML